MGMATAAVQVMASCNLVAAALAVLCRAVVHPCAQAEAARARRVVQPAQGVPAHGGQSHPLVSTLTLEDAPGHQCMG